MSDPRPPLDDTAPPALQALAQAYRDAAGELADTGRPNRRARVLAAVAEAARVPARQAQDELQLQAAPSGPSASPPKPPRHSRPGRLQVALGLLLLAALVVWLARPRSAPTPWPDGQVATVPQAQEQAMADALPRAQTAEPPSAAVDATQHEVQQASAQQAQAKHRSAATPGHGPVRARGSQDQAPAAAGPANPMADASPAAPQATNPPPAQGADAAPAAAAAAPIAAEPAPEAPGQAAAKRGGAESRPSPIAERAEASRPSRTADASPLALALRTAPAAAPTPPRAAMQGNASADAQPSALPLHAAASAGDAVRVSALLAQGLPIDALDPQGRSALMLAAERGDASLVNLLLRQGAQAGLRDTQGLTAADHAQSAGHTPLAQRLRQAEPPLARQR